MFAINLNRQLRHNIDVHCSHYYRGSINHYTVVITHDDFDGKFRIESVKDYLRKKDYEKYHSSNHFF